MFFSQKKNDSISSKTEKRKKRSRRFVMHYYFELSLIDGQHERVLCFLRGHNYMGIKLLCMLLVAFDRTLKFNL